jgi:hypothetical protein
MAVTHATPDLAAILRQAVDELEAELSDARELTLDLTDHLNIGDRDPTALWRAVVPGSTAVENVCGTARTINELSRLIVRTG